MTDDVIERVARAWDAARCATHGPSCPPMSETNLRAIMPMISAALSALRAGDTLPNGLVVERDWRYPEDTYIDARNPAKER